MRVVLAEDLFLLRDGLVRMLEAYDFEIAAAVESGPELTRALAELAPDIAVVDVRLPPSHTDEGLQCALQARRERPGLPVLVLSQHVEQLYARELLADGTGGVETHLQHLHQTWAGGIRRRQPARTRRTGVFGSRRPLREHRAAADGYRERGVTDTVEYHSNLFFEINSPKNMRF